MIKAPWGKTFNFKKFKVYIYINRNKNQSGYGNTFNWRFGVQGGNDVTVVSIYRLNISFEKHWSFL